MNCLQKSKQKTYFHIQLVRLCDLLEFELITTCEL
jgi:hypothetical protein